jgi:hypothetical protein
MRTFFVAGIVVIVLVAGVTIYVTTYVTTHYLNSQTGSTKAAPVAACPIHGPKHLVKIQDNRIIPQHTQGTLCDTLTITNDDNVIRLVAFGPHAHHTPYDGITEKLLEKGQSLTIVLNQAGTYGFHDHFHDQLIGSFRVSY